MTAAVDMHSTMPDRKSNLAKYGSNHALEAQGLALVRESAEPHPTLRIRKSAEGAKADFVIYADGLASTAVGVQLKTTKRIQRFKHSKAEFVSFQQTSGYDGLLLLLVAFVGSYPRVWLLPGARYSDCSRLSISLSPGGKGRDWAQYEVAPNAIAHHLICALMATGYVVRPAHELVLPQSKSQRRLPFQLEEPPVDHLPYDRVVEGQKWQLKLVCYITSGDKFQTMLSKQGGRVGGTPTPRQYEAGDFDWLCLQLPEDHEKLGGMVCTFLIPMRALIEKGLVGRKEVKGSVIRLFPHRTLTERGSTGQPHWTQRWLVDLSSHASALSGYRRVRRQEADGGGV